MRHRPMPLLGCLAVLILGVQAATLRGNEYAGGLRTEFGEVRLQNLAIGKTYSVSGLAEAPLVIWNTTDAPQRVHVQVVIPSHHVLRPGALPLPDRRWVRLDRTDFRVPARQKMRTDVHVTLPYDPDLAGKTFQVDLWSGRLDSRGVPRGSRQVHRLLFTVQMDYRDDTEARFSARR